MNSPSSPLKGAVIKWRGEASCSIPCSVPSPPSTLHIRPSGRQGTDSARYPNADASGPTGDRCNACTRSWQHHPELLGEPRLGGGDGRFRCPDGPAALGLIDSGIGQLGGDRQMGVGGRQLGRNLSRTAGQLWPSRRLSLGSSGSVLRPGRTGSHLPSAGASASRGSDRNC